MQLSTLLIAAFIQLAVAAQPCATTTRPAGAALANVEADGGEFTTKVGPFGFAPDDVEVHYRAAPYTHHVDWVFQPVPSDPNQRNMTVISEESRKVIACFRPPAVGDNCVWLNSRDTCSLTVTAPNFNPLKEQFSYYAA